jgi:muramoyltetrapeptide carboxypeptidase
MVCVLEPGEACRSLYGGTLTQLVSSLGTPYAFDPPPRSISLHRDVDERPYRIDRMLTQLRLSGVLERARLVFGGNAIACDEPGGGITARDVVHRSTRELRRPVVYGFPSGHTRPLLDAAARVSVRLITTPHPALVVEEAPVA